MARRSQKKPNPTTRHACSLSTNRRGHNNRLRAQVPLTAKIIFARAPVGTSSRSTKKAGTRPAFPIEANRSVPGGDRATPAEAVVHTDLDGMLVVAEAGPDDVGRPGGKGGVAEVVILVFGLGGPVRREHVFETGADGVAVLARAVGSKGCGYAGDTDADIVVVAPGVAALGVEQCRTPSVADPAGGRTKLVVFCSYTGAAREKPAIVSFVREPAVLGFSTDPPVGCELVI